MPKYQAPATLTDVASPCKDTCVSQSSVTVETLLKNQLAREKGQFIKATKVGQTHYRVNWYIADGCSYRIVKSRFLKVLANGDTLTIEDKTLEGGTKSKLDQFLR